MPFALTFTGLLLIITGFQDTYKQFGAQVSGDFTGNNNFLFWLASIIIIGSLGYVKALEGFSRAFMVLILFVMVISAYKQNPNIFANVSTSISSGSSTAVNEIGAPLAGGGGSAAGGGGSDMSSLTSAISVASEVASFF